MGENAKQSPAHRFLENENVAERFDAKIIT
jgi:hypothetical protein